MMELTWDNNIPDIVKVVAPLGDVVTPEDHFELDELADIPAGYVIEVKWLDGNLEHTQDFVVESTFRDDEGETITLRPWSDKEERQTDRGYRTVLWAEQITAIHFY